MRTCYITCLTGRRRRTNTTFAKRCNHGRLGLRVQRWLIFAILFGGVARTFANDTPPPIAKFTNEFCVKCHSSKSPKGDFRIDTLSWDLSDDDSRELWDQAFAYVRDGDMPPKKAGRHPTVKDREAFLESLQSSFANADEFAKPGGTPLRRLNRVEYLNSVRDLFGIRMINLPLSFPADVSGAEFDTMPEGLFLSPAVMEAYHETATNIADRIVPLPGQSGYKSSYGVLDIGADTLRTWYGPRMKPGVFFRKRKGPKDFLMFTGSNNSGWMGALWDPLFVAPVSGVYRVRLLSNAEDKVGADGKPLRLGFYTFDPSRGELPKRQRREWTTRVAELEVSSGQPTWLECRVPVEAGETFHIYCENRFSKGRFPDERALVTKKKSISLTNEAMHDPAPTVELRGMEVEGPVDALPRMKNFFGTWPPKLDRAEFQSKLMPLAERAYRRPLSNIETEALITTALEHGRLLEHPEYAWHYAIRRLLCSPEFLYREAADSESLDQYALASRLSYFLWSSLPDEELTKLAAAQKLGDPAVLAQQTRRLLTNPKSDQFVKHFSGQWLGNREVAAINVCDNRYPWDDNVRYGYIRSSEMFFEEVLRKNLPIATFVDSDFTYANSAMRAIWGMKGGGNLEAVAALQRHSQVWPEPLRIDLANPRQKLPVHVLNRRGLLGLPGVFTITGDGVESSPILRGVWVLENLFGQHPPPPPRNVPALEIDTSNATSVRETLKAHTELESCSKCHRDIDPLGLALENFDAVGGFRTNYVGQKEPIIATARMPDGTQLDGVESIRNMLLDNPEIFTRCLLVKLLQYGAGRELSIGDQRVVDAIVQAAPAGGYRFQHLIVAATTSEVFRTK